MGISKWASQLITSGVCDASDRYLRTFGQSICELGPNTLQYNASVSTNARLAMILLRTELCFALMEPASQKGIRRSITSTDIHADVILQRGVYIYRGTKAPCREHSIQQMDADMMNELLELRREKAIRQAAEAAAEAAAAAAAEAAAAEAAVAKADAAVAEAAEAAVAKADAAEDAADESGSETNDDSEPEAESSDSSSEDEDEAAEEAVDMEVEQPEEQQPTDQTDPRNFEFEIPQPTSNAESKKIPCPQIKWEERMKPLFEKYFKEK